MADSPQPGCYGVVDISSWFGWCIRKLTRSRYDHAFIYLGTSERLILEARPTGSAIGMLDEYKGLPMQFSEPAPGYTDADGADPFKTEQKWLGIPYGFDDIAYLGLAYSLGWHSDWLLDKVKREDRMICSQLVADWGAAHSANWSCGQPSPQLVTPGLLDSRLAPETPKPGAHRR